MSQNHTKPSTGKESEEQATWEAFKTTRPNLQPAEHWTRGKIPLELQKVEDESNLPEKLNQILKWSLAISSTPPPTKGQHDTQNLKNNPSLPASDHCDEDGRPSRTNENFGEASRTQLSGPAENDDASESRSVHSERPAKSISSTEKRQHKARHMGNSLIASTLDLLTLAKSKAGKEATSASSTKGATETKASTVECISCYDDFQKKETVKLPCTHSYCKPCLTTLITTALQTEASYPPKCCLTEIPLQTILLALNTKQRETFKEKAAEYAIPAQERWYCPNAQCLKWISPVKLQRLRFLNQKCPHCATKICTICRGLAHRNLADCPQDFDLEATITLAELEGWRRCFKCRTMVERAQGCRHMTCKCGAQFCYSCGAKWRTCGCTEADEVNRQAELRRRRGERATALDEEAAEIARMIAQVEEMERREAEEQRREEERRDAERRREEVALARLERQRLQEEAARKREEEQMERQYREALRSSVELSCRELQSALEQIMQSQRKSLDDTHVHAEQQYIREEERSMARQSQENAGLLTTMESNISRRTDSIESRHQLEIDNFNAEQQDLEDDMFLEIQMHLRGKKDKEIREKRLHDRFQNQRQEKFTELVTRHRSEAEALKANVAMELQGLKLANDAKMARLESNYRRELDTLVMLVAADRAWFNIVSERRQNMVLANNRLMLEALEEGRDPEGLTEEVALTIGPFITDLRPEANVRVTTSGPVYSTIELPDARHEEPWSEKLAPSPTMSASPARSLAELAATSQRLFMRLDASSPAAELGMRETAPLPSGEGQIMMNNSAWAWMTGTMEANTPGEAVSMPDARSHRLSERDSPPTRSQEVRCQPRHARFASTSNPAEMVMSGALAHQPGYLHSSPPFDTVDMPAPLQGGRRRVPPPASEGLQVLHHDETPPVPRVPVVFLPHAPTPRAGAEDAFLIPRKPPAITHNMQAVTAHNPRSSSDSSTDSSSPASVPTPLTSPSTSPSQRLSPTSPSASTVASASTACSSVDSLFLHTLLANSNKPTMPSLSSLSSGKQEIRPARSIWSFKDLKAAVGKGKKINEEEIRERMRFTVGDAL